MNRVWVVTTFSFVARHCWPDAPTHLGHLRHVHEHEFQVRAWVEVTGKDRELACEDVTEAIREWTERELPGMKGTFSCEAVAAELAEHLRVEMPAVGGGRRACRVEVTEDGRQGGAVECGL